MISRKSSFIPIALRWYYIRLPLNIQIPKTFWLPNSSDSSVPIVVYVMCVAAMCPDGNYRTRGWCNSVLDIGNDAGYELQCWDTDLSVFFHHYNDSSERNNGLLINGRQQDSITYVSGLLFINTVIHVCQMRKYCIFKWCWNIFSVTHRCRDPVHSLRAMRQTAWRHASAGCSGSFRRANNAAEHDQGCGQLHWGTTDCASLNWHQRPVRKLPVSMITMINTQLLIRKWCCQSELTTNERIGRYSKMSMH